MGSLYEGHKSEVEKVAETGKKIEADKKTLHEEYLILPGVEEFLLESENEVQDAVASVKEVGEQEAERLEAEHQDNEEAKTKLADKIIEQIKKLQTGLDTLGKALKTPFAKDSIEQAKAKYSQQKAKNHKLLDLLDKSVDIPETSGDSVAEIFTGIYENKLTDSDFVRGVSQLSINESRGTRGHKAKYSMNYLDVQRDYARAGIKISDKEAENIFDSIYKYSGSSYAEMRDAFLEAKSLKPENGDKLSKESQELLSQYRLCEEYCRVAPVFHDKNVKEIMRGIRVGDYFYELMQLKVGDNHDLGRRAVSFSSKKSKAEEFACFHGIIIHIASDEITNAPSIKAISQHPDEDEVLVADYDWIVAAIDDQRKNGDGFYHIMLKRG